MSAVVGEPFLLSSYDSLRRSASAVQPHQNVYVSHHRPSSSRAKEGFATITVNGDGVHVLDVSDLHAAGTYSLGPSTSFAGPSISRTITDNGTKVRRIYAAIEKSTGIKSEDHGRIVWMWDETQSPETSERAQEKRKSITAPHRVSQIHVLDGVENILLLSPDGDVTVMDADLSSQKAEWRSQSKSPVLRAFVFPNTSTTFMPTQTITPLATLVLVFYLEGQIRICVLSIDEDDISTVLDKAVPVDGVVVDASCSPSGYITCLQSDGQWKSFELGLELPGSLLLRSISSSLRIAHLSFIEGASKATLSHRSARTVSILSMGSSLVLLGGVVAQSQDLTLLLWDLRYSVVLAYHTFPLPANLASPKGSISLELVPALNTQVLLSVSSDSTAKSPSSRSAVLVAPVTAPTTSTIANAMGRASSSARWLAKSITLSNGEALTVGLDKDYRDTLDKLRSAVQQNRPEAVDSAFFEWAEKPSDPSVRDGHAVHTKYGHEFVRKILEIVMQPSKPASTLYPAKTIRHILEKRVVTAGMLSKGLLGLLMDHKDWQAIQLALDTVPDLPEIDVISLLRSTDLSRDTRQAASSNDMEVDGPATGAPSLSSMLASCVSYNSSDAALRLAIREQLNQAEVILPILTIIDDWLVDYSSRGANLALDVSANGDSAPVPERKGVPPLHKVLIFLRATLDATFLTLLQHAPSHKLLRRLSAHLQSELTLIDELQSLQEPLGSFAKAQGKIVSEKQKPPAQLEDWRRRRKLAHEQASIGVGLYQIEELVI
ncbi:hypothetical protein BC834DRAFT_933308 [Gloeopeniophorella convolvens]|nr:hypothetical protein BC834DRAFT_933308 [Gloeopeniophorella convolvens]